MARLLVVTFLLGLGCPAALWAQGGPPYYTNDPATTGNRHWEINVAYMPFLFRGSSTSHTPDVDINYGIGDRIQLTYESAWLRVTEGDVPKYGLGQDEFGFKWKFYDSEQKGFAMSSFPQLSINNPNDSAQRGITPEGASLILPVEFSKTLGSIHLNLELGYEAVQRGPDGWLAGVVAGRDLSGKLEVDAELYGLGAFEGSGNQQTIEAGARYKLGPPMVALLMAGRSVAPARNKQPSFVGYFGVQFAVPPKSFDTREK